VWSTKRIVTQSLVVNKAVVWLLLTTIVAVTEVFFF